MMDISDWIAVGGVIIAVAWFVFGSHVPSLHLSVSTERRPMDGTNDFLIVNVTIGNPGAYVLAFVSADVFFVPRGLDNDAAHWQAQQVKSEPLSSIKRLQWNDNLNGFDYRHLDKKSLNLAPKDSVQLAALGILPSAETVLVDVRICATLFRKRLTLLVPGLAKRYRGGMQWCATTVSAPNSVAN